MRSTSTWVAPPDSSQVAEPNPVMETFAWPTKPAESPMRAAACFLVLSIAAVMAVLPLPVVETRVPVSWA